MFKTDIKMQEYISVVSNVGKNLSLIKLSDFYHFDFVDNRAALEWGLAFGEYIGRFHCSNAIWQFSVSAEGRSNMPYLFLYFLGTKEQVSEKIFSIV